MSQLALGVHSAHYVPVTALQVNNHLSSFLRLSIFPLEDPGKELSDLGCVVVEENTDAGTLLCQKWENVFSIELQHHFRWKRPEKKEMRTLSLQLLLLVTRRNGSQWVNKHPSSNSHDEESIHDDKEEILLHKY